MRTKVQIEQLAVKSKAIFMSGLAVIVLFGLLFSGELIHKSSAATANTNALQNVTAGATTIDQTPTALDFGAGAPGDQTSAMTNNGDTGANNAIKVTSTASATFTVSGYFETNWYSSANNAVQMAIASRMRWFPTSNLVITNLTTDSQGANVAAGADANFSGVASGNKLTLASGSSSSKGKYRLGNVSFQYDIPIFATTASDYVTTLVTELI